MTGILQIPDSHFGTEQQPLFEAPEAPEAHVREHRADLLSLSGDITQRACRRSP